MGVPATTGQLREKIEDMEIGDYIICVKDNANIPEMYGIGYDIVGLNETPLGGVAAATFDKYYWYGIKVDKGLIISDRVVFHTFTWDAMNNARFIEGSIKSSQEGISLKMRSLTGGIAYADKNGNLSMNDQGYGAFPTNNEWDKYVKGFPKKLIREGYTLEDIFHYENIFTWCQEVAALGTWVNSVGLTATIASNRRIVRGYDKREDSEWKDVAAFTSNTSANYIGFMPVFEYKE